MRVAILVPYRDEPLQNRDAHLTYFLEHMPACLDAAVSVAGHEWHIYVGVQAQDGRKFSRGKVLNALFRHVMANGGCDRIVLHDVDLVPDVERAAGYVAALAPRSILALNTTGEYNGMVNYIGGICAMDPDTFAMVNGFPNEMEGWGGEDDALRDRLPRGSIATFASGCVHNLETDDRFIFEGRVRAKDSPLFKMPKDERRSVRDLWKRSAPGVTGVQDLVFTAQPLFDARAKGHQVTMVRLDVNVALPEGWTASVSKSTGRQYYVHALTRRTQWDFPNSHSSS